ncbi:MAG: xanthine dehydrogenase [Desulfitibacter sp. BRH_c19]|nr:MAG: xanthine dehydrogenase [Desulfitibacter sp. BRH_c19]
MSENISLTVNGEKATVETSPKITLLEFLRNSMGLMGTKNGCAKGHCGACTVIVNGEAKRACLVKINKLDGATVETIEGISQGDALHPIQKAFIDAGAVQCGFCTPGMIMSTKALLDKNLNPTEDDIKGALKHNICRCTGYKKILDSVKLAAKMLSEPGENNREQVEGKVIGSSPIKVDALDKATGKPIYADDYTSEGMLHGKFLFSEYSHAEILSVDISEAEALDGVVLVLTAKDIPGENSFGLIVPQQPVLADKKVRYLGDVIAAVFAETIEIAQEAIKKIKVEYKPLPVIFSAKESIKEGALLIHDEGNIMHHVKVRKGDLEKGFAEADVIVESEYYTPAIEHAYLEPEACLVKPEGDGCVTIWTGSQGSHPFRRMIARSLGLEEEKVRVIYTPCGGAFGGKEEPTVQIQSAIAALRTGRPVKMVLTREESIRFSTKRHAEHIYMKHGASKDGKLIAFESRAICDTGAYISLGKPVVFRSAVVSSGPYEIPNVKADSYGVYTNNNPAGAFRGFGSTQVAFASELQMDKLAKKLDLDPVELRRINGLSEGKATITGQVLKSGIGYLQSLETVEKELKDITRTSSSPNKKIGIGLASSYKNVGLGTGKPDGAGAHIELNEKGRITVKVGAIDMGQGSDSIMAQITAATIGVKYDLIDVISSDTALCPDGEMTTASRQTYVTGNAVKAAAQMLRQLILEYMALEIKTDTANFTFKADGKIVLEDDGSEFTLTQIYQRAKMRNTVLKSEYHYLPPKTYPLRDCADHQPGVSLEEYDIHYAYCFGTQAAVVEVDTETGDVKVLKMIAAQDSGKAIHPQNVEGQIEGSVMMGIGYALSEEYKLGETKVITDNLKKLGVPDISKTPEIKTIIVEVDQPEGPYGAKGMGEVPINPTAPAIMNAIYDAVGIRINELPATKEKILAQLKEVKNKNI